MKVKDLIEKQKEKVLFIGGSMTPIRKECVNCNCLNNCCKGKILQDKCNILELDDTENLEIDSVYYLYEYVNKNNFVLAKLFGIDTDDESIWKAVEKIKFNLNIFSKENLEKAIKTIDDFNNSKTFNIEEILNKEMSEILDSDNIIAC